MPNAARKGDLTAHGGVIVSGIETVLIEGLPAARLGDSHVCPMCNPGIPPPPHVGGPIAQGSSSVLLGGSAAARVGDVCTCFGPPDCIVQGSSSVMIGDAGTSAGSSIDHISKQAIVAAQLALVENVANKSPGNHWIEYQVVDESNNSINGMPFQHSQKEDTAANSGRLSANGKLKYGGLIDSGDGNLQLIVIGKARWSTEQANLGESVTLMASVFGIKDGRKVTFTIYTINGNEIASLSSTVKNQQAQIDWRYDVAEGSGDAGNVYFHVRCENVTARSPILRYVDWIEIVIPMAETHAGKSYSLTMSNGSVVQGNLNQDGIISVRDISPGPITLIFSDGQEILLDSP